MAPVAWSQGNSPASRSSRTTPVELISAEDSQRMRDEESGAVIMRREDACSPMVQKVVLGVFGFFSLVGLVIFIVCMSAYANLGPDDQVLIKSASGKRVVQGRGGTQLDPFKTKEWRKATLLDSLQYAIVQDQLSAIIRHEEGPQLLFLGPYDDLLKIIPKIVLQRDSS